MKEQLLQYNIAYDRTEKDVRFIAKQLETHLRERFNVLVSTVEYGIKDGHLVRHGTKEPFIESIRKGRDIIQRLSSNPVDVDRENAEVIGFERIDSFLSAPTTPLNSKMLSISPKGEEGSKYQHNFYDIFTLKEKNGERYVEMSRFSSGLNPQDYAKRLGWDVNNPPSAKKLLEDPIKGGIFATPEEIHKSLHTDHAYMDPSEFMDEIWTSHLVQAFVKKYELKRDARSFNAVLNAADEVWENRNRREKGEVYGDYSAYNPSYGDVKYLEEKEVRQVSGGCPGKSGADIDSPFSVSEFADMNYKFDQPGPCKKCGNDVNCGPCGICRPCDLSIRTEQKNLDQMLALAI